MTSYYGSSCVNNGKDHSTPRKPFLPAGSVKKKVFWTWRRGTDQPIPSCLRSVTVTRDAHATTFRRKCHQISTQVAPSALRKTFVGTDEGRLSRTLMSLVTSLMERIYPSRRISVSSWSLTSRTSPMALSVRYMLARSSSESSTSSMAAYSCTTVRQSDAPLGVGSNATDAERPSQRSLPTDSACRKRVLGWSASAAHLVEVGVEAYLVRSRAAQRSESDRATV
eukprot:3271017-Pyramimonas_sp.AAC.1